LAKLNGGAMLLAGLVMVVLGALLQSGLMKFLLDIIGFVVIAAGVIFGISGLVKIVSSKGNKY
jgi:type IV secretory pathway VirB2 component (pilin)